MSTDSPNGALEPTIFYLALYYIRTAGNVNKWVSFMVTSTFQKYICPPLQMGILCLDPRPDGMFLVSIGVL